MKVLSKKYTQNEWVLAEHLRGANTQIYEKGDGSVAVNLHGTEVAVWSPVDNTVKINSGGYKTATTKRRINQVFDLVGLESEIDQKGGEWFLNAPGQDAVPFEEGMVVTAKKRVTRSEDGDKPETRDGSGPPPYGKKEGPGKGKQDGSGLADNQLKKGIEHEKEHDGIYGWLKEYYTEKDEFPPVEEFRKKVAEDHLEKDPEYYSKLEKVEEEDKPEASFSSQSKKITAADLSGVKVYDLGEDADVVDRYTVVIEDDVYSMSEHANHPGGFNLWLGKVEDFDVEAFGLPIDVADLPEGVKKAVEGRLQGYQGD